MKAQWIGFLFLGSLFNAFAVEYKEPAAVCDRISNYQRDNCQRTITRATYLDKRALSICDRYQLNGFTAKCVAIVADKVYRQEDLDRCYSYDYVFTINSCLKDSGVIFDHLSHDDLKTLKNRPYAWFNNSSRVD